jgi:O-acetyl-ADP-ribose deacetylase (regulator of RNase III)
MMNPSNPINYVVGDATNPVSTGRQIIVHCCNDAGFWNAGFVVALSARYYQPERDYRRWSIQNDLHVAGTGQPTQIPFALGQVQFVKVRPGLCVANLIGQHGIRSRSNPRPIRYDAIRHGLIRVRQLALAHEASVHMPRLGAGLAGGNWNVIEGIIKDELCAFGVNVTVYDLPQLPPLDLA